MSQATDRTSASARKALQGRAGRLSSVVRPWLGPPSRAVPLGLATFIIVTASLVLLGWALNLNLLTSWLPGLVHAKFNAALCFLGLGIGLALVATNRNPGGMALGLLAIFVNAIAIATLWEFLSGQNLGIDQLIVPDQASAASPYPGRFAVLTGVGFLCGAFGLVLNGKRVRGVYPTELLALACAVIGTISLAGYLYGAEELRSVGSANQTSLPASVCLLFLGAGMIAMNPQHAIARQMANSDPAGQVARRIVPTALVVVPLGAWLRLVGERAGLYDESIGLSILVTLEALVLIAVGIWTTASVNRLERERQEAQADLLKLGSAVSTPLIETAPVGLAVLDRDLRFLYVNPAFVGIGDIPETGYLGRSIDRVSPRLAQPVRSTLAQVIETGSGICDVEVGDGGEGDGSVGWLLNAEPLRDTSGETVGLALSIVDITERRRREAAVAALSELQKQAQLISESIPFGLWTADTEGHVRYLSQPFLDLIGRRDAEAEGFGWTSALPAETAAKALRSWSEAVSARRPWTFDFDLVGPDGRTYSILTRAFPVLDQEGRISSWAGINLDVTDVKEAEAFREAFAGILSHELKTPVTSIHAASTLLSRPGLSEAQRADLLNDINQESERLRRLVEDLVVLARVERGAIHIHTEPVLLPHLLRKVCGQEQGRWPDVEIEFSVIGEPVVARAESTLVEQVVRNLISNAAKYGGSGGRVDIIADMIEGRPRVRVLDQGPGIDPRESERLFELFYRSPRTASVSGSGVGLFLAQRLIQSMNGTIWAAPRHDRTGAEFGFILEPYEES